MPRKPLEENLVEECFSNIFFKEFSVHLKSFSYQIYAVYIILHTSANENQSCMSAAINPKYAIYTLKTRANKTKKNKIYMLGNIFVL